jgi:dienelactone hydrolase
MKGRKFTALVTAAALALALLAGCGASGQSERVAAELGDQDTAQPAQTAYRQEVRFVTTAEKRIYGVLYEPQGSGPYPLVIYSHELGRDHSYGTPYAEYLAARGIACYTFDFCGGSAEPNLSSGDSHDMSVLTELGDLADVLAAAQQWQEVDPVNIFLAGGSQGGLVTALEGPRAGAAARGLILLYPAFDTRDWVRSQYDSIAQAGDDVVFYDGWLHVGPRYLLDVWDLDTYWASSGYAGPVLILHGDRDTSVPIAYSEQALDIYPNAEYHVIAGGGHVFEGRALKEAQKYIYEFVEAHRAAQ